MQKLKSWSPAYDKHEEPREVFTLSITFEDEDDWLDMREIIEQWDMGWITGIYRGHDESANDVIKRIKNGTAKTKGWKFNKNGAFSYTTGIAHERYNRPY